MKFDLNIGDRVKLTDPVSIDLSDSTDDILSMSLKFSMDIHGTISSILVSENTMEAQFVYVDFILREGVTITILVSADAIQHVVW